jgi:hypothetical protein
MSEKPSSRSTTRREIVKAVFVAPAIITFAVTPTFASAGSQDHQPHDRGCERHDTNGRPHPADD